MKAYLDNSASTMVAKEAIQEMRKYNESMYGNASSLHYMGEEARVELEKARKVIAESIKAKPKEIIFTSGGTESDNLAIRGIVKAGKKKHIITSTIEHPAVLETCKNLKKEGCKVSYIKVNKEGIVDIKKLKRAINKNTALVTIMHANNEIGTIQPIEEIAEICNEYKVPFHTDAVQSYTKVPINVEKITAMTLSAHKIHGPKGVGVLYLKQGTPFKPLFSGGHHESGKRPGTENVAGAVGMAVAASLGPNVKKIEMLRDHLIKRVLKEIPGTMLNGSKDSRLCNNANISFKGIEGESIMVHLSMKGICVSTGSACSSMSLEPSHVLLAMGLKHEEAHGSIRFSISRYSTKPEVDYAINELKKIVKTLRRISPLSK